MSFDLIAELVRARKEKGLSQDDLAERLGTNRKAIWRLETGVGSVELLVRAMAALDLHIIGLARGATLPAQLGNRREALGWTKTKTAERANLELNTLNAVENGRGTVASLLKLLNAIGRKIALKKPTFTIVTPLLVGERDKRFTPTAILEAIERVWGPIGLDPCGHVESPVRAHRRILQSEGGCGLRENWGGGLVFCNPPFSAALSWMKKSDAEFIKRDDIDVVVCLIPAKTDGVYFQTELVPRCDVGFIRGRLQYGRGEGAPQDSATRAPFATMLVVWGGTREEIHRFRDLYPSVWMMHDRPRPREITAEMERVTEYG